MSQSVPAPLPPLPEGAGPPGHRARAAWPAWLIIGVLLAAYHVNGGFLLGNDAKPNVYLAAGLLAHGSLTFTPERQPFMFGWRVATQGGPARVYINDWEEAVAGRPARELLEQGIMSLERPRYYLVPTAHEGRYASTFGPGPALAALPVFAPLHLALGDLSRHPRALWYGGKLAAALCVAGAAALVYLTVQRWVNARWALVLAFGYGLGTCAWSTASQALWQHGPNQFFLALGTYLLVRAEERPRMAAWCGAAYAAAVVCRPTSAAVVVAAGAYLALANRRALLTYVLGGLPLAVLLGAYNAWLFGSPFAFGQGLAGAGVAEFKTGSPALWQTPLWLGAGGLLISPSRGLMVYSPFLAFAFPGVWLAWRRRELRVLRPLTAAVPVLWCVAFKWFDWWGGWCYGYRPILDTAPLLCVLIAPVLAAPGRRAAPALFGVLLAWSVAVQVPGAFAYNLTDWNARLEYELVLPGRPFPRIRAFEREAERLRSDEGAVEVGRQRLDVDLRENRHRLWSAGDSQIVYYFTHFRSARARRREGIEDWLANPAS